MLRHCLEWNQFWKKLSIIENKWWPCTKNIHQELTCNFESLLSSMKAWTFPKHAARIWWHTRHHLPDYCHVYSTHQPADLFAERRKVIGKTRSFWLCKPQNNRSHYKVKYEKGHTLLWLKSPLHMSWPLALWYTGNLCYSHSGGTSGMNPKQPPKLQKPKPKDYLVMPLLSGAGRKSTLRENAPST